ncbi:MAG TPA: hypothetical protein PLL20_20285 [Phycisphaerae bacterium]|nr:hypothetical protein [Phycisphaerae bacterium]HRR86624.1 hypothetical protein [Phycisphaerae bacterium]
MKTKMYLIAVGVMIGATSVMGVGLTVLPATHSGTNNANAASGYHIQGMTDDGAYVVGTAYNPGGPYDGANGILIIKVSDLTTTLLQPKAGTSGRGIAYTSAGLMVAGAVGSNSALGRAYDAGSPPSTNYYLDTMNGTTSEVKVAQMNCLSIDAATGNGWLVGERHNGKEAVAYKYVNGVAQNKVGTNPRAFWEKQGTGDTVLNGVSNTGLAVGTDNGGKRAIYADVANNGDVTPIPQHPNSTGEGQGNGMSAGGLYASGYMKPLALVSDDSLHAFLWKVGSEYSVELLPAGGDIDGVQQSNSFDVSDNGTAVGFTWNGKDRAGNSFTGYRATVWENGNTTGVLVQDILTSQGVDLSAWQYLERCISVTPDGLTIAGRGVLADGTYRGFVAVIPEPAGVVLLGLGSLLLRRRR